MRVLADVRAGRVTLYARSGNDVTASYPELGGLGEDYDDMLLDGGRWPSMVDGRLPRSRIACVRTPARPRDWRRCAR